MISEQLDKSMDGFIEAMKVINNRLREINNLPIDDIQMMFRAKVNLAKHNIQAIHTTQGPVLSFVTIQQIQNHLTELDKNLSDILDIADSLNDINKIQQLLSQYRIVWTGDKVDT